jgi:sulfoxide reductase catalytic subunit YedY
MVIKKPNDIKSSEITPENVYLNRRNFIRAGVLAGTTLATTGVYRFLLTRRRLKISSKPTMH